MKILILDDDNGRHDAFREKFESHDRFHTHTVDEAIDALVKHGPFDVAFLDHDLNDYHYQSIQIGMYGKVELNGFDVASFIARVLAPEKRPKTVIVHSWNPPGAEMMMSILKNAGVDAQRWEFEPKFHKVRFS